MKTLIARRWMTIAVIVLAAMLLGACGGGPPPASSWAGVVVSGNMVYLTGTDRIYAIDIADTTNNQQRQKWTYPPADKSASVTFHGQPFLSEDGILVTGTDSTQDKNNLVLALDTKQLVDSGEPPNIVKTVASQWSYPTGENPPPLGNIFGGTASDGESVYVASGDGRVLSLDLQPDSEVGHVNWVFTTTLRIWSMPVVSGTTVYVASQDHNLYALDAATGKEKWRFAAGAVLAGTPTVYRDTVYVGSFDQKLYAVNAVTGQAKWEFQAQGWLWDGPAVFDDKLYFGDLNSNLYAVRLDGTAAWDEPLKLEGVIRATPLVTADRIYVPTGAHKLFAINRATRETVWIFPALTESESFLTTPVLVGERLLVPPLPAGSAPVRLYAINALSGNMEWQFPAPSK